MKPSTAPSKARLKAMDLNDVHELQALCNILLRKIGEYRHVSDHLPPIVGQALFETSEACGIEMDRRFNNSEN